MTHPYTDVQQDAWYTEAILWAVEQELLEGVNATTFGITQAITREEIANVLWRYEGQPEVAVNLTYSDNARITPEALSSVAWVQTQGILTGKPGNNFDPQGQATRAEVATILQRYKTGEVDNVVSLPEGTEEEIDEPTNNILVAYFTRTGTTRTLASYIQEATDGELVEIVPVNAYPTNYDACLAQANAELAANARPAVLYTVDNMDQYDTLFIGYPIWYGQAPMAIRTFLEAYDLSGKTIIPFCTSGSSGIGGSLSAIRALVTEGTVLDGLGVTSSNVNNARTRVNTWIEGLGLAR